MNAKITGEESECCPPEDEMMVAGDLNVTHQHNKSEGGDWWKYLLAALAALFAALILLSLLLLALYLIVTGLTPEPPEVILPSVRLVKPN